MAASVMTFDAAEAAAVAIAAALLPAHNIWRPEEAVRLFAEVREEMFAERDRQRGARAAD